MIPPSAARPRRSGWTIPGTTCGSATPSRRPDSSPRRCPAWIPRVVRYVRHHEAHAASAGLAAPFGDASVLVCDGRGEAASHLAGHYAGGKLEVLASQAAAALARAVLRAGHRSPGLPALQRRVQGDGARLLRYAAVRSRTGRAWSTRTARAASAPTRWTGTAGQAPGAGRAADRRARGPGGQRAAGDRGRAARAGPLAARPDRGPRPGHGGRGRAELRGQLPAAPRGPVRADLGPARRRRRGHRAGRRALPGQHGGRGGHADAGRLPGPRLDRRELERLAATPRAGPTSGRPASPTRSPPSSPPTASWPGSRAAASSARGRSAAARCSPTRAGRPTSTG